MTDAVQTEHSLKKQYLLAQFFTKYQALIEYVQTLEIHPQFKLNAITNLDQGMFWAREGIINIPAPVIPVVEEPTEGIAKPTEADKIPEGAET